MAKRLRGLVKVGVVESEEKNEEDEEVRGRKKTGLKRRGERTARRNSWGLGNSKQAHISWVRQWGEIASWTGDVCKCMQSEEESSENPSNEKKEKDSTN
jgi:hypothetical protein